MIRLAWRDGRIENPKLTKAGLARLLGVSVATVRGVLNGHESYRRREYRHASGMKEQTLILGF